MLAYFTLAQGAKIAVNAKLVRAVTLAPDSEGAHIHFDDQHAVIVREKFADVVTNLQGYMRG